MKKLSVRTLLDAGFKEVDCWTTSDARINPPVGLPAKRGVYAFALDEEVVYVGLASRSLKQRLGFYARPGTSQKTNVRLNAIILELLGQGQAVRILIAHPEDGQWNGIRMSGPEGLEAALIEDYDLPWNVRGSKRTELKPSRRPAGVARTPRGSNELAILNFVKNNPHCTELQIAKGIFGPSAVQPQANPYCRKLNEAGLIERLQTRPYTYVIRQ